MALIIKRLRGSWFREAYLGNPDPVKNAEHENIKSFLKDTIVFLDANRIEVINEDVLIFIGRNRPDYRPGNIIVLDSTSVSSQNSILAKKDGVWTISDMVSRNGTIVKRDNQFIISVAEGNFPLQSGDKLIFGGRTGDFIELQVQIS